jgi:hypothetical protein
MGNSIPKTTLAITEENQNLDKDGRKGKRNTNGKQENQDDKKVNTHGTMLSGGWRRKMKLGGNIFPTHLSNS